MMAGRVRGWRRVPAPGKSAALGLAVGLWLIGGCGEPPPHEVCLNHSELPEGPVVAEDFGDEGRILIADTGHGRLVSVDRASGQTIGHLCMANLMPASCGDERADGSVRCGVYGFLREPGGEADHVLVTFSRGEGEEIEGGVANVRIGPRSEVEWRIDRLAFEDHLSLADPCPPDVPEDGPCRLQAPHGLDRWIDGEQLVVADNRNNRILVLSPPEEPGAAASVSLALDEATPGWDHARWPNAVQVLGEGQDTFLLVTFRGVGPGSDLPHYGGRIVLWDVTAADATRHVWTYPAEGYLAAVHDGHVEHTDSGPLLVYAHSRGAGPGAQAAPAGSVGVARMSFTTAPGYLGDLVAGADEPPLGFVRSVELIDAGQRLLVTDSGCENAADPCQSAPAVLELGFTAPSPSGGTGAHSDQHDEQRFHPATVLRQDFDGSMRFPYSARHGTGEAATRP